MNRYIYLLLLICFCAHLCNGQEEHEEHNDDDDNSLPDNYIQISGSIILVPASSMDDPVYVLPPEEDGDGETQEQSESQIDQRIGQQEKEIVNPALIFYPDGQSIANGVRLPFAWNNQQPMPVLSLPTGNPANLPPITKQIPGSQQLSSWWYPGNAAVPQYLGNLPTVTQTPATQQCNNQLPPPPPCVCPNLGLLPLYQQLFPLGYNHFPVGNSGMQSPLAVLVPNKSAK